MIVVIQCAASKRPNAGHLRARDGRRVVFVAEPEAVLEEKGILYARPDDPAENGKTWRDELIDYNRAADKNPLGLLPAFELYQKDAYRKLAAKVGLSKLFILSAGWGLIAAPFLTPYYDITFTNQSDPYRRRRKSDSYRDFSMLPQETTEPIVFFGGKDYLPMFDRLTRGARAPRIVFYNAASTPQLRHGRAIRFQTNKRMNWHYECVDAYLTGALDDAIRSSI